MQDLIFVPLERAADGKRGNEVHNNIQEGFMLPSSI